MISSRNKTTRASSNIFSPELLYEIINDPNACFTTDFQGQVLEGVLQQESIFKIQ